MLTKDQILSITDKALKEIEVPEWGGSVFIRGATIDDSVYFDELEKSEDPHGLEKLIIRYVCDADGKPLFTEEDIPAMQKKSLQAFNRIANEIKLFNSMEGIEKNLESTPA